MNAVPFHIAGFFISSPPDFFFPQKSATQQYFSALRFESSSALNIEIGENSLAYFDDNKLRASV